MALRTRDVELLGYAGLIPFIGGAGWSFFGDSHGAAETSRFTLLYGGLILSFLGGLNWGFYFLSPDSERSTSMLYVGVLPSLIALLALIVEPTVGGALIIAGFLGVYVDHRRLIKVLMLPEWLLILRRNLTVVASLSVLAVSYSSV